MKSKSLNHNSINHIGVIADGVRRWSQINNVPLTHAYLRGIEKTSEYASLFFKNGIKNVSIFGSSIHNFKRTKAEISAFTEAETIFCTNYLPQLAKQHNTKVISVGQHDILPTNFRDELSKIEKATENNNETKLYLLVAYDPIEEIIRAFSLTKDVKDFPKFLNVPEYLDLIIRTSGANLLSNFLPLQSGSARLYTLKKLFNDTTEEDIQKILNQYKRLHLLRGE